MRFSTPECRFSIMESRWGLIPDMGASVTLRELVRMDVAKELTMTGRIITGLEAEKIGLVTRCVDDPMKEAIKVAKEIIERCVHVPLWHFVCQLKRNPFCRHTLLKCHQTYVS